MKYYEEHWRPYFIAEGRELLLFDGASATFHR